MRQTPDPHPESFLPLNTDALMILLAVANEPRHGYGIIRDVEDRSNGSIVLQTGALYRTLKRLRTDGLLAEVDGSPHDGPADTRRRYYKMTALGATVLEAEVKRMSTLVKAAKGVAAGRKPRLA
jgi:DNA-binding PadR family transcriptional regulator